MEWSATPISTPGPRPPPPRSSMRSSPAGALPSRRRPPRAPTRRREHERVAPEGGSTTASCGHCMRTALCESTQHQIFTPRYSLRYGYSHPGTRSVTGTLAGRSRVDREVSAVLFFCHSSTAESHLLTIQLDREKVRFGACYCDSLSH